MNRRIIYLACALLIMCATAPTADAQPRRQKGGTNVKKDSAPKPRLRETPTIRPDLSVVGEDPICYEHTAKIRVDRIGSPLANSFYVSLKIYKGASVVESIEQLVAPFTNSFQHLYFTPATRLLRMEAAEQLSCQFTADVHNQIPEIRENNNVVSKPAPLIGFGPHE